MEKRKSLLQKKYYLFSSRNVPLNLSAATLKARVSLVTENPENELEAVNTINNSPGYGVGRISLSI